MSSSIATECNPATAGVPCCLLDAGVACVYAPKDFDLTRIMGDIVEVVDRSSAAAA